MIRATIAAASILLCASTALPQRAEYGVDSWRGRVESVNASTREITVTPLAGGKSEPFTGVLAEGFKAKLLDDSVRELNAAEIPPGMRVRVFYKTRQERVGGRNKKVAYVYGMMFLGRDVFDRLRVRLDLPPMTVVTENDAGLLPPARPLKLFLAIDPPRSKDELVKWVGEWNKDGGDKYGPLEVVSDRGQADVSLVVYNTQVELVDPSEFGPQKKVMILPSATVFLVAPKGDGLDVLWNHAPLASNPNTPALMRSIAKEIEKRMKARSKAQGK